MKLFLILASILILFYVSFNGDDLLAFADDSESYLVLDVPVDPEQHHLLGIVDGIQTYQNTKYGFAIDYPSSLYTITNYATNQKNFVLHGFHTELISEFGTYPPFSKLNISYHQNYTNSIVDDGEHFKKLQQLLVRTNEETLHPSVVISEENFDFSKVMEIDGHKAYQVMSTHLMNSSDVEYQLKRMQIITHIVQGDSIISIFVSNTIIPPEIYSSEYSYLRAPQISNESLIDSVNSFRFVNEKLSVQYVDSEVGLEISLPDSWTVLDYTQWIPRSVDDDDVKESSYGELHESFDHLFSSVNFFPDNPSHLPKSNLITLNVGNKSDMFLTQSPLEFLTAYEKPRYETSLQNDAFTCTVSSPEQQKINQMQSYRIVTNCDNTNSKLSYQDTSYLLLTDEHFVLLTSKNNLEEQSDYPKIQDNIIQSLNIKNTINSIDDVVSNIDNKLNSELDLDPELVLDSEPSCGAGTELVDGFCQVIKTDEESSDNTSFLDKIFGFFKNLFN